MKSKIFTLAIYNRHRVKFLYGLKEVVLDPYFICLDRSGKKVVYGKADYSNEIKRFEFVRIANIKVLNKVKFSPIIPLAS
ncbi:MAG: hypothetical protein ACM34K_10975 [Bacillota bacterium]